jgi:penicillin G amidase
VAALARGFELRTPAGGDTYTLNVSRVALVPDKATGELYLGDHGPSLRAIYDLGDPANSRMVHSSGQSGLPFAAHYRSFFGRWTQVQDVPLWQAPAEHVLVLSPRPR